MRIIVSCLFLLTSAAYGEVYKWTDADGKVHYGDKPPVQIPIEQLDVDISPVNGSASGLRASEQRLLERIEKAEERAAKNRRDKAKQAAQEHQRQTLNDSKKRQLCESYRERVDKVQQQLRSGYSVSKGRKLHRKLRDYAKQIRRDCR